MRTCVVCGQEKELEKFRKRQVWRSHTCKACYSAKYATGKPNTGRFVKGHESWRKGKTDKVEKRKIPRYIKKGRPNLSEHPYSVKRAEWALAVKTRDCFKCQGCGSEKNLNSHHIVPWKQDEVKRFELENGITLCNSCHMRTERFLDLSQSKNSFQKWYEERRKLKMVKSGNL